MLSLANNGQAQAASTYASQRNARFNDESSNILSVEDRWISTYNNLPTQVQQTAVTNTLASAIDEFRRNNPTLTSWADLKALLPEANDKPMVWIKIDATMQRLLKMFWSMDIVGGFNPIKLVPIQVYRPNPDEDIYVAWDGQHTLVALWLIATQVFGEDPTNVMIPVNIYKTHQKAEMRDSFVGHNGGEYKETLDQYDKIEQMIYGVRIDNSNNPEWVVIEQKQRIIEHYDLFLTKKDNGDAEQPGAISRMQEVQKLSVEALGWLCEYLVAVGCHSRAVEEKEMVMMSYFFTAAYHDPNVKITDKFIKDVAYNNLNRFNADFNPDGPFWDQASTAYYNWHSQNVKGVNPRFNKEAIHGFPFLVAQLNKDLSNYRFPVGNNNSPFVPMIEDLF